MLNKWRAAGPRFWAAGRPRCPQMSLRQVEQTDLIQYGLIPEFVGRFPIISSLQVRCASMPHTADQAVLIPLSRD